MNTLIAIGTLAAYFYSVAVTVFLFFTKGGITPAIYFDTSAIIIALILLGKYFEVLMKGRASEAIKNLLVYSPRPRRFCETGKKLKYLSLKCKSDLIIVRRKDSG